MLNNLLQMHLTLLQKEEFKQLQKIADKILKVSKPLQQNNSETFTDEEGNNGPDRERYISPD